MAEITAVALDHKFGPKGSNKVNLIAVNCGNCAVQCAFTGLFVTDAVINDANRLVGGRASTTVFVAKDISELETTELKDMTAYALKLGSIENEVPLDDLTDYTVKKVAELHTAGNCLVTLAQKQNGTALL